MYIISGPNRIQVGLASEILWRCVAVLRRAGIAWSYSLALRGALQRPAAVDPCWIFLRLRTADHLLVPTLHRALPENLQQSGYARHPLLRGRRRSLLPAKGRPLADGTKIQISTNAV